MTEPARFATIIIRILAAGTMLYAAVGLVFQAVVIGLVPGGERAAAVTIGPILTLIAAGFIFRRSRQLGAWVADGV